MAKVSNKESMSYKMSDQGGVGGDNSLNQSKDSMFNNSINALENSFEEATKVKIDKEKQ